jgi:hypothetical protein
MKETQRGRKPSQFLEEGNGNGEGLCINAEHQMYVKGISRTKTPNMDCLCYAPLGNFGHVEEG